MCIVLPFEPQFVPAGSRWPQIHVPAAYDYIAHDPADQAEVDPENGSGQRSGYAARLAVRPKFSLRLSTLQSRAVPQRKRGAISDAGIQRLRIQLLKDELMCPTQQSRQEHHCCFGFPPALSGTARQTNECRMNHKRLMHANAFFARRTAR